MPFFRKLISMFRRNDTATSIRINLVEQANAITKIETKLLKFKTNLETMISAFGERVWVFAERKKMYRQLEQIIQEYESLFKLLGWDYEELEQLGPEQVAIVLKVYYQRDMFFDCLVSLVPSLYCVNPSADLHSFNQLIKEQEQTFLDLKSYLSQQH